MNLREKIDKKRDEIISELYDWAETFNPESILYNTNAIEEEDELEMLDSYNSVCELVNKLEKNECSEKDYEDILFHIEQINHNEKIIKL
ncbi:MULTISPECIES: hypothetical protein [Flavobacterium]|uniref:Uncharacterized protein n=1 Tax=Flavobacterium azooxidireducens TaxID=1871076 RepID=A0ABY4KLF9_9FLAO|nr:MULTISPECIES: hypothetical protein [Flavobacterium]UPQ80245.1 hypothetical protein M0M57_05265 [Flavobacterium azooxidireducens]